MEDRFLNLRETYFTLGTRRLVWFLVKRCKPEHLGKYQHRVYTSRAVTKWIFLSFWQIFWCKACVQTWSHKRLWRGSNLILSTTFLMYYFSSMCLRHFSEINLKCILIHYSLLMEMSFRLKLFSVLFSAKIVQLSAKFVTVKVKTEDN